MKSIVVFVCCVALGLGVATAEQKKEGKGKKGAGQGRHAQQGHPQGGGGGGGKKGKGNRQGGGNNAAQMNAGHGGGKGHKGQHTVSTGGQANVPAVQKGRGNGGGKAQVKHFDFANSRNTTIKSVTFKENRRIVGAEHWSGNHYVVFRNYHSVWHDRGWWGAHYPRVVLIGGGWYYWNAGFWFPAWGYERSQVYYPYDGPIYGYNDLPPDQVVANVQEELQNQGYYHGDVDGMLGPLTRAAIADYQADHDLTTTSAIDEPTMSSLGFS
jgi:hypothetical protein